MMHGYEVLEAAGGGFILTYRGFQIGPSPADSSGARDYVFATRAEAWAYANDDATEGSV